MLDRWAIEVGNVEDVEEGDEGDGLAKRVDGSGRDFNEATDRVVDAGDDAEVVAGVSSIESEAIAK